MRTASLNAAPAEPAASSRPAALAPVLLLTDRLRTRARLLTLVGLLVLPTLFATWSFTGALTEQIDFAASERTGVEVVHPAVVALAQTAGGSAADLSELEAAVAAHPELGAQEALAAVQAAAQAGDGPADRAATATALASLITAVGDSSKLILDPDLDSFYVMDAIVVQLPRALSATAASAVPSDQGTPADRIAARAVRAASLTGAADAVRGDISTAQDNSARADLADALQPAVEAADAVTALADLVTAGLQRPDADEEAAARSAVGTAAVAAAEPLAAQLDGLLEVRADAYASRRDVTLALTAGALALAGWFAAAVVWRTRRDVELTVAGATAISDGDLHPHLLPSGQDEFGDIGRALGSARGRLQGLLRAVGADTTVLREASTALVDVSAEMRTAAEESAAETGRVSTSASEVSGGVQTVSDGTAQMAAAVQEISSSAASAARVAADAVAMAEAAGDSVTKLGQSSTEISGVLALIGSIAAQTNLLALNASIEAARAGEYGKGFAVVAHEVKELAQQTASATEEVGRKVSNIQADAGGAAEALSRMHAVTSLMNDHSATIAAAVEEQTATTNEMTHNLAGAAAGSQSIADTISAVVRAADRTSAGAARTDDAATAVAEVSSRLDAALTAFRY
jgi:methyl-accepting chemotaxis protein